MGFDTNLEDFATDLSKKGQSGRRWETSRGSRLDEICRHAATNTAFYRERFGGGQAICFFDFPIVTRNDLTQRRWDFVVDEYRASARTLLANGRRTLAEGELVCEYTSGSSGFPLTCFKSRRELATYGLSLLRKRKRICPGYTPDQLFCFIHNEDHEGTADLNLGDLGSANIARTLSWLRESVRPAVLHANPMLLMYYAEFIRQNRFDLGDWRIQFIESVAEGMSPAQKSLVEEQFKTTVINCYGCLETYNIAYECPLGELHLNEHVHVEIVPTSREDPLPEGCEGEIVLTSLVNLVQPVIRYAIGDFGALREIRCNCGNERPVLRLSGRRRIDYLRLFLGTTTENQRICGYDVFSAVLKRLIEKGQDKIIWCNVIQRHLTDFEVQYLPGPDYSPDFRARFSTYASEELRARASFDFVEKQPAEVVLLNRKNRMFRSLLQND